MNKLQRIEELENKLAELKEEVKRDEIKKRPDYPYVTECDGTVILITKKSCGYENPNGYVLNNKDFTFGSHNGYWCETLSKPFTGTIEYKNGKPV